MRRFAVLILGLCGFAAPAFAQFTTVTATVTDPSGIPYAGAVMNAILVPGASGGYTLGGQPYSGRVGPVTLDSTGKFTAQFGDVTLITPGSPQWQITIDSAAATVQAPLGTGPQSFTFTSTGTTISGSSPVSLTSALNALAPKLTNFAVGGTVTTTGTPVANQVAEFSSATAIAGNARFTDNGTTLSYTGSGGLSVTGGPSIFNNAAGGGALDIVFGLINRIHGSCGNGSGYRFATIEAGNADITMNATQGGYNVVCPDNTTDTATGQNEIGSTTKTVVDELHPGNQWLDNTSSTHTYSWGLHNASALVGANLGAIGGSRTGGAFLNYGCSANTTYGIISADGQSGTGQAYAMLDNIIMQGCSTGTVGAGSPTTAMLEWTGISGMNEIRNFNVFQFANTYGFDFNQASIGNLGPLACTNCWTNGNYNAGALPLRINATDSTHGLIDLSLREGADLGPCSGCTIATINGNGTGNGSSSLSAIGTVNIMGRYSERISGSAGIHYAVADASNVIFHGDQHTSLSGDTIFDLSETGLGRLCNFMVVGDRETNNPGTPPTAVNNHVSNFTMSGKAFLGIYDYGGDASCPVYPNTFDSRSMQIVDVSGTNFLFKNFANSELDAVDCNAGLSVAGQSCLMRFFDHTVSDTNPEQCAGMVGATHSFAITEGNGAACSASSFSFQHIPSGETRLNSYGANGVNFNAGTNSAGSPGRFWSGGATPIEVARIDTSGNFFLGCHTTTFQNCTELTAPNAAGGASAAVMTWPATGGTVMVTGQNSAQKTQRFGASCTTAASAAATCTSTFSWTTAFADANYTPVCWGEGPAGSPIISLNATQVAASVTVQVQAATAVASSFAGVYCHATHD